MKFFKKKVVYIIFKRFYLFIFREREREGKTWREKHHCMFTCRAPPTGDLAHSPGLYPDWESNWWLFGSQATTQTTEPLQPGLYHFFKSNYAVKFTKNPLRLRFIPSLPVFFCALSCFRSYIEVFNPFWVNFHIWYKQTHKYRQEYGGNQRGKEYGKVRGVKYMVTGGD